MSRLKISLPSFVRQQYVWNVATEEATVFARANLSGREERILKNVEAGFARDSKSRTIFFLPVAPEARLFVKRYKIYNWLERLKSFFFVSKAAWEYEMQRYLKAHNIPVARPVATLEVKNWGFLKESFLFLTELKNVTTLKEFITGKLGFKRGNGWIKEKQSLLKKLAELVRSLHLAGFYHEDLHLGNILIEKEGDIPKLYLADLHQARRCGMGSARKIRNLAQLCYSLNAVLPLTDVARFLTYYRSLDLRKETLKPFIQKVFSAMAKVRHQHLQSRSRRCLKKSSGFNIERYGKLRIYHPRLGGVDRIKELITQHRRLVSQHPEQLFKATPKRLISIQTFLSGERCYLKEYRYSMWRVLESLLGRHPARSEWLAAHGLAVRRVKAPDGLALVEEKVVFFTKRAYVIFKEVQSAIPSGQYALETFGGHITPDALVFKKAYLKSFARAISHLHQRGIFHADLKANNILVRSNPVRSSETTNPGFRTPNSELTADWSFYFLDLDRVRFERAVGWKEKVKNLSQLNAATPAALSRTDRLRFFDYYLTAFQPVNPAQRKQIIRRIMKITIARHHFWPPKAKSVPGHR